MSPLTPRDVSLDYFIPVTPTLIQKIGLRDAYIIATIQFRCSTENKTVIEDADGLWWRKGTGEWATEMKVTRRTLTSALTNLEAAGMIESRVHSEDGWSDQTKSYRVLVVGNERSTSEQVLSPKTVDREQKLRTVLSSKESLLNICRSEGETPVEEAPKRGAHLLPKDWMPTKTHRAKADALGVDLEATAEAMRKWAFVGDVKKKNWHGTFNSFLTHAKPSVVSVPSAESQVDRIIASGDREALERLTGVRFDPDFGDVSPRERFELLKVEWQGWARENRVRLVSAAVSHSKLR